jgi:uncharacterized membrane protein YhaH (DUF805 family)
MVFYPPGDRWLAVIAAAGILLAGVSFRYVPWSLPSLTGRNGGQDKFLKYSLAPLVVSSCLLTAAWEAYANHAAPGGRLFLCFVLAGALVHVSSWLFAGQSALNILAIAGLTGLVGGSMSYLILVKGLNPDEPVFYAAFSVPALIASAGLTGVLLIGLASKRTTDDDREWWSRDGAWLLIALIAWISGMMLGVGGPCVLLNANNWIRSAVAAAGGISGLISILVGRSPQSSSGRQPLAGQPPS